MSAAFRFSRSSNIPLRKFSFLGETEKSTKLYRNTAFQIAMMASGATVCITFLVVFFWLDACLFAVLTLFL